jgi:hypothetical protein
MSRRPGAAASALTAVVLLAAGCGGAAAQEAERSDGVAPTPSVAASERERTMREIIAEGTSPSPVPPDERPLAPDGSGPVGHRSARIEDADEQAKPRPTRLRIPALGIAARIAALGVAADGEMEVPADPHTVAWYELAAHVDYSGARGVFFELAQLDAGDRVAVEFANGRVRRFTVEEQASIEKEVLPIDDLFRRDGEAVLTLITCGGEFDAAARSYRSNVVVRAVAIDG